MVPAEEPTNDVKKVEPAVLDLASRKKKKGRVAVSIRKGTLLFFPTAVPIAREESVEPPSRITEGKESEGK